MKRSVLAGVCTAVMLFTPIASAAPATSCWQVSDPDNDQVAVNSGVSNEGAGPASLDVRSLRVSLSKRALEVRWELSDLQRPVPGQSWSYRLRLAHAESTFLATAVVRTAAMGAEPVADQFSFGDDADKINAPAAVPGRVDEARHLVIVTVPATALGRSSFDNFTLNAIEAYANHDLGRTLGLTADEVDHDATNLNARAKSTCRP